MIKNEAGPGTSIPALKHDKDSFDIRDSDSNNVYTAWITSDAVQVIKDKGDEDGVNVWFLYAFATGNLLVDIISSSLFYKYRFF